VKHYTEALDDLNAAIEADPTLSKAYLFRASVLRQICRCGSFAILDSFTSYITFLVKYRMK